MKIQEIISSAVMFVVSALVLIGFTIAWFSISAPVATGMAAEAAKMGEVQVALEPGGTDISFLPENSRDADIGVEKFVNLDEGKLAPGTYGKVTFYVTPISNVVSLCDIAPTIKLTQDGSTWYPAEEEEGEGVEAMEELYDIAQRHIAFFADEAMTIEITEEEPYQLKWTAEEYLEGPLEKEAVLYWKWYYEYPFSQEEEGLTEDEKNDKIDIYDDEDMRLGNNVSGMKFHFTFTAQ
ncbi:MAG: hypothetical protein E7291_07600 [Lachnospiraceae bacterium]|nr:hypothetical protein [Lachnospiraceae bacterium]